MSNELEYCWGNADARLVEPSKASQQAPQQALPSRPSLSPRMQKSYDWPDPRDRRDYRVPVLPSTWEPEQFHKDCPRNTQIRQRGGYWWVNAQCRLEDEIQNGTLQPVLGTFYCFLETWHKAGYTDDGKPMRGTDTSKVPVTIIVRYGNVYNYDEDNGYHWITRTVVFPKEHPDAEKAPYHAVMMEE